MRRLGAGVALAVSSVAFAAVAADRPRCTLPHAGDWREYRSPHFAVTTHVSRTTALALVKELENTRALVLQALFGEQVEIPGRVRVVAFGDPQEFRAVAPANMAAYVKRGADSPIVVFSFQGGAVPSTHVAHELVHHLSWFHYPWQPSWFAEGLAEFIESVGTERPESVPATGSRIVRGGRGGGRWAGLVRPEMAQAVQLQLFPVRDMLAWKGAVERADWPGYHESCWLLYHWLWNERSKQLTAFQEGLSRGDAPDAAWRAAFPELDPSRPETLAPIDAALERYRKLGSYLAYRVEAAVPEFAVAEAPVPSADLHVLLLEARAAWPEGKEERAAIVRAHADEALREDPGHPVATALRQGVRAQLVAALRTSASARPGDARAWLLLGDALDAATDAREKEAALRKAVALDRDGARANNDLAWLLVETGRAREARPFAERALDLAPWNPAIVDTLAAVAMKIGQCRSAVQLERRAADALAGDAEDRSGARKRLAEYEAACGAAVPRPR